MKTDGAFMSAHEPCVNSSASHSPFLYSSPPGRQRLAGAGINLARFIQAYHSGGLCRFAPLLAPALPYFADPAATDFSYLKNLAGFLLVLT
ncbi:hypothetical protein [Pseudomonas aeruginosa]|uniref:hypothetical protein n=1 Tax=Pseudomonas aeruginosa TaxID=287 RepID=UPI00301E3990